MSATGKSAIWRVGPISLSQKGRLVVLAPLVYQLVFLILLAFIERQHAVEARSVLDVTRAEAHLDHLFVLLHEAESAMRGYVLTGDASFAGSFDEAHKAFQGELAAMHDSGTNAGSFFERDAERVFEFHHVNRQLLADGQREIAVARIQRLEGKRLMDSAQRAAEEILGEQRRLQAQLQEQSKRSRSMLLELIGGGMALNLVIALLTGGYFGSSITRRLRHVIENTRRLDRNEELIALGGGDEIAALDEEYRRVATALRERTRRAEQINRELETFSYSVSHDLRAPLRAIGGYARMLAEDHASALDDDGKHFLGVIRQEADRMGRLIDDLLDLSRTASRPLRCQRVDVAASARHELERLRAADPSRSVDVAIADLPLAQGDAEMIGRVMANLLGNAWKYTRGRDRARIEVGGSVENGLARYFVRDNGAGFDMRYADKLFRVFERLHGSDQFEGTGVGLALVERIVARHGGSIQAEGETGRGATFYFTLPLAEEQEHAR